MCLFVGQYEQRKLEQLRSGHERGERFELDLAALIIARNVDLAHVLVLLQALVLMLIESVRVDDVDDAVGGGGVAGPLRPLVLLPADVPQLHVPAADLHRLHVAADGRDRREAAPELQVVQDGCTSRARNAVL